MMGGHRGWGQRKIGEAGRAVRTKLTPKWKRFEHLDDPKVAMRR
jgi:hypothetical protein